jgi:hypothetical protein
MISVNVQREDGWVEKTYQNAEFVIDARDFYYSKLVSQFGTQDKA